MTGAAVAARTGSASGRTGGARITFASAASAALKTKRRHKTFQFVSVTMGASYLVVATKNDGFEILFAF